MTRFASIAILFGSLFLDIPQANGGNGTSVILPAPRVKARSGLRMSVDTEWVSGSGYRPIKVTISPINGGTAVADRYIDVRIRPRGWYGGRQAGAVTATVALAQGAKEGTALIDVPQTNSWNAVDIDSFEDGRYLTDLCGDSLGFANRFYNETFDGTPAILVIRPKSSGKGGDVLLLAWPPSATGPSAAAAQNAMQSFMIAGSDAIPADYALPGGAPVDLTQAPALRGKVLVFPAGWFPPHPLISPMVVLVDEWTLPNPSNSLPDIRALAACFPVSYANGNLTPDRLFTNSPVTDAEIKRLLNELPYVSLVEAKDLPDHWLSYSSIDVIIAKLEDLENLAKNEPERWQALRRWLSTGTTLCVYDVGDEFQRLSDLSGLIGVDANRDGSNSATSWVAPEKNSSFDDEIKFLSVDSSNPWWYQQAMQQRKALGIPNPAPPANPTKFLSREVQAGRVVAIAAENPFPGTQYDWSWVFNNLPAKNWLWQHRHGLSFHRENVLFWNFLIRDIGRAPVFSFLTLITLFAIVIGPLNYFVLHRKGQLYLLLVTVPLGAFLVTSGLMLYATIADGLGIRARVRSFTKLDQKTGDIVSWSRHLYYAGLAPSRGLVYPTDAAVYPIDYRPISSMGSEDTARHLIWGDEQNLITGYFQSRTACQFMVVEPRQTTAGLRISSDSQGALQVANELGMAIQQLLLCDETGTYHIAGRTESKSTAKLSGADPAEEARRWKALLASNRLTYPAGFDANNLENVTGMFGSGPYYNTTGPQATLDQSLLESSLRDWMNDVMGQLTPRTYIAAVERPPQVSLGVESAKESNSFHVIVGTW